MADYNFLTEKEHIERRAMWLGSKEQSELLVWYMGARPNDALLRLQVLISEALLKCADEIIVNACDQAIRAIMEPESAGGPVRNISVLLDTKTGELSVTNDGRGMQVYWEPKIQGWSVQGIVSRTYSGSNFEDNPDQVTGGINGLGMKLININSEYLTVETVDVTRGRYYRQTCRSAVGKATLDIEEPLVVDLALNQRLDYDSAAQKEFPVAGKVRLSEEQRASHTTITFLPRYSLLCKGPEPWKDPENLANFEHAIRGRLCLLSAFLGTIGYRYVRGFYEQKRMDPEDYRDWQLKMGLPEEDDEDPSPAKSTKTKKVHSIWCYEGGERIEYDVHPVVRFQGREIPVCNITDLAARILPRGEPRVHLTLESHDERVPYPWYLVVSLSSATAKSQAGKFQQLTIVNGIYMEEGGSHVDVLVNKLTAALAENARQKVDWMSPKSLRDMLKSMLHVINIRQIPVPQMGSQAKTSLKLSLQDQTRIKHIYHFKPEHVQAVWELVEGRFADLQLKRELEQQKRTLTGLTVREASHAYLVHSKRHRPQNRLLINEGDSAKQTTDNIIKSADCPVGREHIGSFNTRGVPPNTLKNIQPGTGGVPLMSRMLQHNVTLQGLYKALQLDYEKSYWYCGDHPLAQDGDAPPRAYAPDDPEFSAAERKLRAKGDEEFAELPYGGGVIIATDQDQDGIGHICSLLLVYFIVFWPELVKRGYLHRLKTPLVRVYYPTAGEGKAGEDGKGDGKAGKARKGRKRIVSYYTEREFEEAMREQFGGTHNIPPSVEVKYYKGLGGHSKHDIEKDLAPRFEELVVTFTWDEATRAMTEAIYGRDTSLRKPLLLRPVEQTYSAAYDLHRVASCTEHFAIESVSFQQEFASRKIKSAIDGLIPSQRKALAGGRLPQVRRLRDLKVYQLSGIVAQKMAYHHGDASMNELIIKMLQPFPGSNLIPAFLPLSGAIGGRGEGRSKNGGARYIDTAYNAQAMDLLFPPQDDCLLEPTIVDGEEAEPKFYVPIVPYSILETSTTTGAGWNINVWARDRREIWKRLERLIRQDAEEAKRAVVKSDTEDDSDGESPSPVGSLLGCPALTKGQQCYLRKGLEVIVGDYQFDLDADEVRITDLPPKLWSVPLCNKWLGRDPTTGTRQNAAGEPLPRRELVLDVQDNTTQHEVDILVRFKPGGLREVVENDFPDDAAGVSADDDECLPIVPLDAPIRDALHPIDRYLGLYLVMVPRLNMLSAEGIVREFETYEEVVEYWYPLRKRLYQQRLEREAILLELQVLLLKETIRYVEAEDTRQIVINKDVPDAERHRRLAAAGFWLFNTALLNKPGRTPVADLRRLIALPAAEPPAESQAEVTEDDPPEASAERAPSYAYIERITTNMRSAARMQAMRRELAALERKLEEHRRLTWKGVWLAELKALAAAIDEGQRTFWTFERADYVYEGAPPRKAAAKPPKKSKPKSDKPKSDKPKSKARAGKK